MTEWHMKSKRKASGGVRTSTRRSDKKLAWRGGTPSSTTITETKEGVNREARAKRGKTLKVRLKHEKFVIAAKKGEKKAKKLEIIGVEENNSDRQFARRNIITRGAVLKAKDGSQEVFVKVTSRPGQSGTVFGVIMDHFEKQKAGKEPGKKEAAKKEKTRKKTAKPGKEEKKAEKE